MKPIEAVARAIRDRACEGLPELPSAWWMEQARAALTALAENITPEMVDAGERQTASNQGPASQHDCKRIFQAMIDAALGETGS